MSLMTKLDAVNAMLLAIGEAPVNQLGESFEDTNIAESILDRVSRQVQARGWHFNTENSYTLVADIDGYVNLPGNTLKVDAGSPQYAQRGLKLYDRFNHTFVINKPVNTTITFELDFLDLPIEAKEYITIAASRRLQQQTVGSTTLDNYNEEDQQRAWLALNQLETEAGNYNLNDNTDLNRMRLREGDILENHYSATNLRGY